jgi:hypothetical protein
MKRCFKCGVRKPSESFYAHPMMADGRLGKCIECAKNDVRQNYARTREAKSEYDRARYRTPERRAQVAEQQRRRRASNPEKERSRSATAYALRTGKLIRQPCEVCGAARAQAHHDDYAKPLDVRWLCFVHHRAHHGQTVTAKDYDKKPRKKSA